MELLLFKTKDQLIQDGIARLEKTALNVNGSAGKICRLYLNLINDILGDKYECLKINHIRAFLSTADADALDSIGYLLNCGRQAGEIDDNYKYRISQQTLTAAAANETAIRLAALSVDGVEAVVMKPFTYGTGSYSIYVVTAYAVTPDDVLQNVTSSVQKISGYGIKFDILSPSIVEVQMSVSLSFSSQATDADKTVILSDVKSKIMTYINSRNMGESLSMKTLNDTITQSNGLITNVLISSLRIDGKLVFVGDQDCRWNQRFLTSSQPGAITVQAV